MTCVGASLRAFPSTLPFTTNDRAASVWTATLLSTPSRSQTMERRMSLTQALSAFGVGAAGAFARPTPMLLCLQTALGPSASRHAPTTSAAPAPTAGSTFFGRGHVAAAASATAESRMTTAFQQPGAVRSGSRPNPPASAPAIPPTVFQK